MSIVCLLWETEASWTNELYGLVKVGQETQWTGVGETESLSGPVWGKDSVS